MEVQKYDGQFGLIDYKTRLLVSRRIKIVYTNQCDCTFVARSFTMNLSLTHMDHLLIVDHHNNFTLQVYLGDTFKHRVELQEILV